MYGDTTSKEVREAMKELQDAAKSYEEGLRTSGSTRIPDEILQIGVVAQRAAAVTGAIQLGFLFSKPMGADIRGAVQSETRLIRAAGLKEKEVLPASMFARAFDALSRGGRS